MKKKSKKGWKTTAQHEADWDKAHPAVPVKPRVVIHGLWKAERLEIIGEVELVIRGHMDVMNLEFS